MQRRVSALYVHTEARRIGAMLSRSKCSCVDHRLALDMARKLGDDTGPRPRAPETEQLELVLSLKLPADFRFACVPLHCAMTAVECVRRQVEEQAHRTHSAERGQAGEHPTCKTEFCKQGADIRGRLDPSVDVAFIGRGPNGTFDRGRSDLAEQEVARKWLKRNGLLEPAATLDTPLAAVELEGE